MSAVEQGLRRLREGNRRFVDGSAQGAVRREGPSQGQEPFAIVLGCSDSRVPAEIVFDQGVGDLFVVRVAGNVVARSQIESVEFAAERFGTQLVVVLGHTRCGAVEATIEELLAPPEGGPGSGRSIVERVRPSVEPLIESTPDREELLRLAVRANVRASVDQLQTGSPVLRGLVDSGALRVVGAEYDLDTGRVEFLTGG